MAMFPLKPGNFKALDLVRTWPKGKVFAWDDGGTRRHALLRRDQIEEDVAAGVKSRLIDYAMLFGAGPDLLLRPSIVYRGTKRTFRDVMEPDWQIGDEGVAIVTRLRSTFKLRDTGTVTELPHPPTNPHVFDVWVLSVARDIALCAHWQERYDVQTRPDSKIFLFEWVKADPHDPTLQDNAGIRYKSVQSDGGIHD